ncbi:MAG: hypothetical protein K6F70_07610, partial [Eggerthellaceae bacterium]|nr:hypothetical protein [Eggerthellaceae bacterium]
MSGSASIRDSRMKFAKGVLSAFMAVVTVVGFTPIVPYQAHAEELAAAQQETVADEVDEATSSPSVEESAAQQTATANEAVATQEEAGVEADAQLQAQSEDEGTALQPMSGVSCMVGDTFYETIQDAVNALAEGTGGTIKMIGSPEAAFVTVNNSSDLDIEIDLNGKTVPVKGITVGNNSTVLFTDTSSETPGKVVQEGSDGSLFELNPGDATTDGGCIMLSAGTFESTYTAVSANSKSMVIVNEGASLTSSTRAIYASDATVNVNENASVSGYIELVGTAGLSLGSGAKVKTAEGTTQPAVSLSNTATLYMNTDSAIIAGGPALSIANTAEATISGATVTAANDAISASGGMVTVTNGSTINVTGESSAAINVTDGTIDVMNTDANDSTATKVT